MYDFAIIGSGVSGARIAWELTAGGARCVLLEAGRAFDRHSYPRDEMGYSTQMFWGGGLEISRDGQFGFLRGKCLGGTSVVNQADLDRFDDLAWDDWRDRSGIAHLAADHFAPHYDHVLADTACSTIPAQHHNRNARLFSQAFDQLGYRWQPLERAQSNCALEHGSDCIVCLGGCPRDSKQSALVTVIPRARNLGLEIETEFDVDHVEHLADRVRVAGRQRGSTRQIEAGRCVLAAGALGNCGILFRSAEIARRLPALGRGFCCHPQYMSFGVMDEVVDAHRGALQAVQAHDRGLRLEGVKFENVFAPPIAVAMLLPGLGVEHSQAMLDYRHLACIEVAVRDEPLGVVRWNRRARKLVVDKPLSGSDQKKIQRGLELVRSMLETVGARRVIECQQGFGLHLMGGCCLGTEARHTVVNSDYELHGFPRLLAADSSVFPAAPGINPSFTIMALSCDASRQWLRR